MRRAGGDHLLRGGQNLGDAGLVVRAEQRGAVGGDERHARQLFEAGEGVRAERMPAAGEEHVAAVVVLDDLGPHVLAGEVRRGVHMRDEAERGHVLHAGRGGEPAVDDAELIDMGALDAHRGHLVRELAREVELARGAGRSGGIGIGGRVDLDIVQKAFIGTHGSTLLFGVFFLYYSTPRCKGKAVLREVVNARDLCYAIISKKWRLTHGLSGAVPPLPSGAV